jgi:hypothetical protein
VVITPDKSITADINDLYYNCTFVQLETTPVSIIGALSSLAVYKDRFYTYDSHGGGAVHCFDKHGKFLFKIAKHGNGPGETMRITDFCIDERNNILWIADNYKKIQKYDMDGHLINEYRTDFALKNIVCVPESNDLLALRFGYYKDKNYQAGIYSLKNNQILIHNDYISDFERITSETSMSQYNNHIVYAFGFSDTLYHMDKNGFHPQYAFDFGEYKVIKKITDKFGNDNKKFVLDFMNPSKNYAGLITNILETDDFITFRYDFRGKNQLAVYSKTNNEIRNIKKITVNSKEYFVALFFRYYVNNIFYSVLQAESISENMSEQNTSGGYGIYSDFNELEAKIKADDNPIVVFGENNMQSLFK